VAPNVRARQAPQLLESSALWRVKWQAEQLHRLSDPLHHMTRQMAAWSRAVDVARQIANSHVADLAQQITAGSRTADVARQITFGSRQLDAIQSMAEQHRRLFARLGEARWQPLVREHLFPTTDYLRRLAGIAERFKAAIAIWIPANLYPLSANDLMRVLELGREEGIALAWVPRTALVQALLDAADAAAREQLLIQEEAAVLEDCAACLNEVTIDSDMVELAGFVRQAADICRGGTHAGAQALATNVVETIAKHHLERIVTRKGKGVASRIRARFGVPISDSISLDELRIWLVGAALFAAYREDYDYAERGTTYNRAGTAHCVNPNVYRPANALKALLLATSLLRLMDEELADAEQVA
jgi:hypothetical protein